MKKIFLSIILLAGIIWLKAQTPVWSTDIAPILYSSCTKCHHEGGLSPFPLMNFHDAYINRFDISNDVTSKKMPPWKAIKGYNEFRDENRLSEAEIETISGKIVATAAKAVGATLRS